MKKQLCLLLALISFSYLIPAYSAQQYLIIHSQTINDKAYCTLIAKHENKTVGELTIFLENEQCTYKINVENDYQNSSVTRQLLAAMCKVVKAKNPQINLATLKTTHLN